MTRPRRPTITSGDSTTFTVGIAGTFTVTATGFPAPTFTETGTLPTGVTLNATTGVLSGTPGRAPAGTYPITITATNGNLPNATQSFTLTVDQAPAITSGSSTTFTVGTAGTFTVTATGYPAPTFAETGTLPTGVTFNATTGVLSGTPAAGTGGYLPDHHHRHQRGHSRRHPELHAHGDQAPAITSGNSTTFTVGTAGTFTVTATGYPGSDLLRDGHPADRRDPQRDHRRAVRHPGRRAPAGTYPITITATNGSLPMPPRPSP